MIPYGDDNFGTPLEQVNELIVPTELFFVRCNGGVPTLDPETWRLDVGGLVEKPFSLSLADLQALPHRSLVAFMECAGNGRTRFEPLPEGTPWRNDAVGNALWEGVSLRDVLNLAAVDPRTVEIVSQGADFERMNRGLPLAVANDPDTLVAWSMNGAPLTPEHGAPVRLFVPGWAGIASTKWLTSLTAVDEPWQGYYNVQNYVIFREDGSPVRPVQTMPVKSIVYSPQPEARLSPGRTTISGFAWSGDGAIARVEISTDGGATFADASITHQAGPRSWVRFALEWDAAPGLHRLRSRAFDDAGNAQPDQAEWNLKGYQMNGIFEVPVSVE